MTDVAPQGTTTYVYQCVPEANAGTPETAPVSTPVALPAFSWLWLLEVRIPAGHQGVTGLALVDSGQYIVPYGAGAPAWLVGNDDLLRYPYGKEVGANVVFYAYNTGAYNHTWQCRLVYSPVATKDEAGAVIISPDVAEWLSEVTSSGE